MRPAITELNIQPMSDTSAQAIAGWQYPPPYDFYNAAADDEDLAELMDPKIRAGQYFEVLDEAGELVGFFQYKTGKDPIEIGLGLRPDLAGKGLGVAFVQAGMDFARDHFGVASLSLEVATFNTRARLVYERAGFVPGETYLHRVLGRDWEFLRMRAELT
jgi:ribosomal-protein-alanine N-acetyltransferase